MTRSRSGMTLLEALVALVIVATVGVAMLEVFAGSTRVAVRAEQWSRAVAYAEDALETMKLDSLAFRAGGTDVLADGFTRRVSVRPWTDPSFVVVTVDVTLPGGGTETLTRLWPAR